MDWKDDDWIFLNDSVGVFACLLTSYTLNSEFDLRSLDFWIFPSHLILYYLIRFHTISYDFHTNSLRLLT